MSDWISVKDRLPETKDNVFVLAIINDKENPIPFVSIYDGKLQSFTSSDITHWSLIAEWRFMPSVIEWFPYPEYKPEEGNYLVTFVGRSVKEASFECGDWYDGENCTKYVIAFAPIPEPYKGPEEKKRCI